MPSQTIIAIAAVMSSGLDHAESSASTHASAIRQDATSQPKLLRQPDIFGNTIVFVYSGDLWVSTTESGAIARRLTSFAGPEARPRISPDGKMVAFTGTYDGAPNIYVIPIEGGEPRRLTYSSTSDQCLGWTPDGKVSYATNEGNPYNGRQPQLRLVSPAGGISIATPIKEIGSGQFSPDGKKIAYNRQASFNFNWRRYRGGSQGRVSIFDFESGAYSELPSGREQSYHPLWVGNAIYYISDRGTGNLNLFKNVNGKDTQLTKNSNTDIRWPETDGKTVIYERDGDLIHFDPATNKETQLGPKILSENLGSRTQIKNLMPYLSGIDISPSGNRVLIETRGELFSVPAKPGETRNMTRSSGSREGDASYSPDGKQIAYFSDATGEREVYLQPQAGGDVVQLSNGLGFRLESISWAPDSKFLLLRSPIAAYSFEIATKKLTKITEFPSGGGSVDVSQDSKWIAFTRGNERAEVSVWLHEVETGKQQQLTEGYFSDSNVVFDHTGKWLYLASSRNFNPGYGDFEFSLKIVDSTRLYAIPLSKDVANPFIEAPDEDAVVEPPAKPDDKKPEGMRIDFEGANERTIVLPFPGGGYSGLTGTKDGLFFMSGGTLNQYKMGAKSATPIYEGIGDFVMTPNRQKMVVLGAGGVQVLSVQPGLTPAGGRVDTSNVEATVDLKAEFKQMYWDAWRYQRDYFYDSKMAGVDWDAVGKQYAKYLPYVNHRSDFNVVLGLLIGELGTGHAYLTAPGDVAVAGMRPAPVGSLCADFVIADGGVKFSKIMRGSNDDERYQTPLGVFGMNVKEGDFLVAVDGNPINDTVNPSQFLVGKVGRMVTIMVNSKPGLEGGRKVRVKPVANDILARYYDFIEGNRKLVAKLSGGRIGYMHIQNTGAEGSQDFARGFYNQWSKDALIVDERWNGGGYIQPWYVDTLSRSQKAMIQPRYGSHQPDSPSNQGPAVMLVNEYAGSGGDFFPYMFRKAKRGEIIGRRTWGGLVGIDNGFVLVDGGGVTAPSFSIYDPETGEIIAENTGISPDIDIDMRPDLVAKGLDPQLEAAIKLLMEKLAKMPAKKVPNFVPKVSKPGKINP